MRRDRTMRVSCAFLLVAILVLPAAAAESKNSTLFAGAFVTIDPVGTPQAGDAFTVTGTTNIGAWDSFLYFYIGEAGHPGRQGTPFYMANVTLTPGEGNSTWSVDVDPGRWLMYTGPPGNASETVRATAEPGEYAVYVATPTGEGPERARSRAFVIVAPGYTVTTPPPALSATKTTLPARENGTAPPAGRVPVTSRQAAPLPSPVTVAAAGIGIAGFALCTGKRRR